MSRFINNDEDSISQYFKDVRKEKLLTPEQEVDLAKQIAEGDEGAIDKMVRANLRFVISVAKQYQNKGLTLSDLIAEGNHGLMKAATRFDHTKGFRFISYAVWWIKQTIVQSLNENSRTIRVPVNVITENQKLYKELQKASSKEEEEELRELFNVKHIPQTTSLFTKIDDEGSELIDLIADEDCKRPDYCADEEVQLKKELDQVLSILSPREQDIIKRYFGLQGESQTLEAIGEAYSLTKERIRQIKEKSIRKLRNNSFSLFRFMED
jgi:RNA polymerase primary sigma factor|tara:strand:+ start:15475 stop:16275 length:801 start_codon:yes stop_codon:yes gene_type:complete